VRALLGVSTTGGGRLKEENAQRKKMLCFGSCKTSLITYRNGYIFDKQGETIGNYTNGYIYSSKRILKGYYSNGYIYDDNHNIIGNYANGYVKMKNKDDL
jgi:hypothetical protein